MAQTNQNSTACFDIISATSENIATQLINVNLSIQGRTTNASMLPDTGTNISAISKSEKDWIGTKGLLKLSVRKPVLAGGSSL
jgi:hypothetical protein